MENNKGKKNILIITGIAMLLVTLIGATFAWFAITAGNNNANLVTTGTLQIRYTDTSNLYANNLKPATDAQVLEAFNSTTNKCIYVNDVYNGVVGEQICAYNTFTITNIGSLTAYVDVLLEDITNTYVDLKYALFETVPQTLSGTSLTDVSTLVSNVEMLKNTSKTYTLLIWLDESATLETITNKTFGAKITAIADSFLEINLPNAPVLADGMIPITYNRCGDIALRSQETYPQCYNYVNNINSADRAALIDMCVDYEWFDDDLEEQCEMEMDYIISTGESYFWPGDTLEDYIEWLEQDMDYVITLESSYTFSPENFYTVKADVLNENNSWYDYSNKQWANAVMVSSDTRDTYMDDDIGTRVYETDILAYYVWIPRYKYQLFNIEFEGAELGPVSAIINENNAINTLEYKNDIPINLNQVDLSGYEQLINVVFEKGTETTGTVRCSTSEIGVETCTNKANGNWYTHPAFTFGEDELEGLWVGKFETTYGTNTTDVYPDNTVYETPTIKPNVTSLRNQQVSKQFETAQYFGTSAYLTSAGVNEVDAHMMKNIEWGAVAYLKQSVYGLGTTDIAINNSSSFLTGKSSGDPAVTDISDTGFYSYNENKIVKTIVEGSGTNVSYNITNDTTYPWIQLADGTYKSQTQGVDSSTTNLTVTLTLTDSGVISFDYSVSSEADYDYLYYTITNSSGTVIDSTGTSNIIGGTRYGTTDDAMTFITKTHNLEAGSYTVVFTYTKDSSYNDGTDAGYVKNIKVLDNVEYVEYLGPAGQLASTTGNITGVYDMAGGIYEYTMGVIQDNTTTGRSPMSGNSTSSNSGYIGKVYPDSFIGYTDSGNTLAFPTAKYYDLYASGTSSSDYTISHLGDATGETNLWYDDDANFPGIRYPWFLRGGRCIDGSSAGVFNFRYGNGNARTNYGFRVALSTTGA